jgi:hypothetical protein
MKHLPGFLLLQITCLYLLFFWDDPGFCSLKSIFIPALHLSDHYFQSGFLNHNGANYFIEYAISKTEYIRPIRSIRFNEF